MSKVTLWAAFITLLIGAYIYDQSRWRVRPREKLLEMIRAPDWRLHKAAMTELRRRGEDIAVFLPRFVLLLAADSRTERAAAETLIRKFYPQAAQELKGYSPIADVETCRVKIAPLVSRCGSKGNA
jgi:hypothetical protein